MVQMSKVIGVAPYGSKKEMKQIIEDLKIEFTPNVKININKKGKCIDYFVIIDKPFAMA
jgi:hypothetical protein